MASPVVKFMEEHQDFVLKLKIKASDGTSQIRRVRLPRISDKSGAISYDELVGLVVTFTFPEDAPDSYSVSLTYFDVDEDTVTIASTDELVDAIEQYAGKKVLRISTEVKPKTKPTKKQGSLKSPPQPTVAPNEHIDREVAHDGPGLHPQVQTVLESFVGILSTAVTSLQEGLATQDDPLAGQAEAPTSATPKKAPSTDNDEGEVTSRAAPPRNIRETLNRSSQTSEAPPTPVEEPKQEEKKRPFIHGRHTCDSCLTTPIIGNRYNAQNLPDYDLCENCYKNYQGDEVTFEVVELDRDRAFQERWHRRRERIQGKQTPSDRQRCARGRRPRWGGPAVSRRQNRPTNPGPKEQPKSAPAPREDQPPVQTPVQPPAPVCPPPPPYHHMRPGFFGCAPPPPGPPPHWANLGPHAAPHIGPHLGPHFAPHSRPTWGPPPAFTPRSQAPARPSGDFDNALKEAIRRSLRDIAPKEAEIAPENSSPAPPADEPSSQDSTEASDAVCAPSAETAPADIENPTTSDEKQQSAEATSCEEPSEEALSNPDTEETATAEEPSHPEVEEQKQPAQAENEVGNPEEDEEEEQDPQPEVEEPIVEPIVEPIDDVTDTGSSISENSTDDEDLLLPSPPATPNSKEGSKDESFASDAVGSGDVAEAMGATLDMVAGVISEMLFEADAHNRPPVADQQVGNPGELIVDSVQTKSETAEQASNEESEWQFVKPDENEEATPDNEIGRAAEMLGSALFNSDMQSSAENVSTLSTSDSFSVPSTVPSISSGPRVAAAQREQWSTQLATLNELGFEEGLCIETLERLKAANIGVGSDDDISVTQVVDAIMGQN